MHQLLESSIWTIYDIWYIFPLNDRTHLWIGMVARPISSRAKYTARSDKQIFWIITLLNGLENFASNEPILGLIG